MFIELNMLDKACYSKNIESEVVSYLKSSGKKRISKKHSRAIQVVSSNLVRLTTNEDTALLVSLSDNHEIPERYNLFGIYGRVLSEVLDSLQATGYVNIFKGKKGKTLTVVKPTSKFLKVFPYEPTYVKSSIEYIILKNKDKSLKSYKDDKFTRMSRVILDRYNAVLANTFVTFEGKRINNEYYRIFNEDFTKGGRYYRASVLSLSGADRTKLQIDGSPVCEVDFTCMHVALLLGIKGLPLNYNPYSFLANRKEAKKVMNIVLCSQTKEAARQAVQLEINLGNIDVTKTAKEVLELAEQANLLISDKFYSGNGLEAMYFESEIATDVISTCLSMDVAVLAIHDGFVCQKKYIQFLAQVMLDAFVSHVGVSLPVFVAVTGLTDKEESWRLSFEDCPNDSGIETDKQVSFKRKYDSKGNREYEMQGV